MEELEIPVYTGQPDTEKKSLLQSIFSRFKNKEVQECQSAPAKDTAKEVEKSLAQINKEIEKINSELAKLK